MTADESASLDDGNLVVETSTSARSGGAPDADKARYKRYERGHGG
jgi:hypothetical protein